MGDFTYEGLWMRKKCNNSAEMAGCLMDEYVQGTIGSGGSVTVYTKLQKVLCHSLTYSKGAACTTAISVDIDTTNVTDGGAGLFNTITVYGDASTNFKGFLTGRTVEN